MNGNVLISGASIAGHSLAFWLRRYGFIVTLVEVGPAPREGGYAIDFRGPEHLAVLARMGILEQVRHARTNMRGMSFVDQDNKKLAALPRDLVVGDIEILRSDLIRILHRCIRDDCEFVFGDSIVGLVQNEREVQVTFERGQVRNFDLVIGADGLHSNVRMLTFGDESQFLRYLGYQIAFFTTENNFALDYEGRFYNVPGKVAGLYSARKNTEAKAFFAFQSPMLDFDYRSRIQQQQILADAYAGEGWEIPRLLDAMSGSPDFYFDSASQIHLPRWSNGRVAFLGDAACCASPLSGLGTGLAMVGGYVLAGELAIANGDHRIAFSRYEEQMRDYAVQCQRQAEGVGEWFVPTTWENIDARNLDLQRTSAANDGGCNEDIASSGRKAASAITLKDYLVRK